MTGIDAYIVYHVARIEVVSADITSTESGPCTGAEFIAINGAGSIIVRRMFNLIIYTGLAVARGE